MASAFAHIIIPVVLYAAFKSKHVHIRLCLLAMLLSVLPDFDVVAFKLGIAYESQWGHRGFTHSLLFASAMAAFFAFFKTLLRSHPLAILLICFIACASHALLDALTNGGLGVALYWPFQNDRIFFAFRPIQVSPIGIGAFFSERGMRVIASELLWVILPGLIIGLAAVWARLRWTHSLEKREAN